MSRGGPDLRPDDGWELLDLVHRYAARVDDRDLAGAAALFAADGVLATPSPPTSLDPVDEATGTTAVAAALERLAELPLTVHAVTGAVFDRDRPAGPDSARGRVTATAHHVTTRADGVVDLVWHLRYRDSYRRTADGWRFARRALHIDLIESRRVARARGLS